MGKTVQKTSRVSGICCLYISLPKVILNWNTSLNRSCLFDCSIDILRTHIQCRCRPISLKWTKSPQAISIHYFRVTYNNFHPAPVNAQTKPHSHKTHHIEWNITTTLLMCVRLYMPVRASWYNMLTQFIIPHCGPGDFVRKVCVCVCPVPRTKVFESMFTTKLPGFCAPCTPPAFLLHFASHGTGTVRFMVNRIRTVVVQLA